MNFEEIYIPSLDFELLKDTELVDRICDELGKASIDPAGLVFTGIDAEDIQYTHKLPARSSTHATPYEELRDKAADYDRNHSIDNLHPFNYAREAAETPAIVAYEQKELIPEDLEPNKWLPKSGDSVSGAARAIIFFADRDQDVC